MFTTGITIDATAGNQQSLVERNYAWAVTSNPMTTEAGNALRAHYDTIGSRHLRELLAEAGRVDAMSYQLADVVVDLTRARADATTFDLLAALAIELQIPQRLQAMATGAHVNTTEDRPALHTALRLPAGSSLVVDGQDVAHEVESVRERVSAFVSAVHSGEWRGATGERISNVVNIGIGGSDLGPRMVVEALRAFHTPSIDVHFVANVDPVELDSIVARLQPETTLFVIVSKTFTTVETLANAKVARAWLTQQLGENAVAQHVVAVTADTERAAAFGISETAVFGFWDWVGGRFSLSSAVGLAIELAIGTDHMRQFLAGMHAVDEAVLRLPARQNPALLLGMLDVWYTNCFGTVSKVVVPYSHDLALLPAYLQQLQMESNGKSVDVDGNAVTWQTAPSVWGAPGTNGQHAFFQMLHQGTDLVPVEFVGIVAADDDERSHLLHANLVAQAAALARGRTAAELTERGVPGQTVPYRVMAGNRPSTLLLLSDLSPTSLGQLLALYEHSTVVSGLAWGVNPFDQWGVELGKELAGDLLPSFTKSAQPLDLDAATAATLARLTKRR